MEKRVEQLIDIIVTKTGLSKDKVRAKVVAKQRDLGGLVSEEGAAYIVSNELGVKTKNRVVENSLKIADIRPEMRAFSTVGRVKAVFPAREFTTKTGTKSKVANLEILDDSGTIRIALWNMSDVEKVEKDEVKVGDIVQIKNGYARAGYRDGVEINIGSKGALELNPEDVDASEFPDVSTAPGSGVAQVPLKDVKAGEAVSIVGKVTHNFGVNTFQKEDRSGKVANLVINDGTGSVKLVLWNEKADIAPELEVGTTVRVLDAYAKEGQRGVEVQANARTTVEKNPEGVTIGEISASVSTGNSAQRVAIKDLISGDTHKELRGAIVNVYGDNFVYEMCPKCNKRIVESNCQNCGSVTPTLLAVVNALIDDGTGNIRAAFFREQAEKLVGMNSMEMLAKPGEAKQKLEGNMGKEVLVEGRVKENAQYDRLEFNVFSVADVDAAQEAQNLAQQIQT